MQYETPNMRLAPMVSMIPETAVGVAIVAIVMALLVAASVSDLRKRRVPDSYWALGAAVLIPLASLDAASEAGPIISSAYLAGSSLLMLYALSPRVSGRIAAIPLSIAVVLLIFSACNGGPVSSLPLFILFTAMYRAGILAGGADAKCLMLISLSLPDPLSGLVWGPGFLPPALLTLLLASVLASASVPLVCLARGSGLRHPTRYPMHVDDVDTTFVWPVERMEGNQRIWCRPFPDEADAIMEEFRSIGAESVMVTPVVPFILPIAIGFAIASIIGDPFSILI